MEVGQEMNELEFKTLFQSWSTSIYKNGELCDFVFMDKIQGKWAFFQNLFPICRIYFSRKLLELPKELIEYVVVHEIVHLFVQNHGKLFKAYLLCYLPDYKEREELLKQYAPKKTVYKLNSYISITI